MLYIKKALKAYSRPIIAVDTEDNSAGKVLLINIFDGQNHFTFTDPLKFLDKIYSIERPSYIVCHNLQYDLINIFRDLNFRYIDSLIFTSTIVKATMLENKHIWLDSFSFARFSLKYIGKIINHEKLDFAPDSVEYCRRDTEIVYFFMQHLLRFLSDYRCELGCTIGQMSLNIFRQHFLKRNYRPHNSPLSLSAYYGGRCEVFYKGKMEDEIYYSDVVSMYPYVMQKSFPDTNTESIKNCYHTAPHGAGIFSVNVPEKTFIPILPFRAKNKKLLFPVGKFIGAFTFSELRLAENFGVTVLKEIESEGYKKCVYPFIKFTEHFFQKKKAASTEYERTFFKLILNNLYGKLAQHTPRRRMSTQPRKKKGEKEINRLGVFHVFESEPNAEINNTVYLWGAYVTSYARIELFKRLNHVYESGARLLYCDTDSVLYNNKKNLFPESTGKLGEMDTKKFYGGEFLTAKCYVLNNKAGKPDRIACKGVPSDYAMNFITGGEATFKKPVKLREGLIQDITANIWHDVTKEFISVYDKREGSPVTFPVKI